MLKGLILTGVVLMAGVAHQSALHSGFCSDGLEYVSGAKICDLKVVPAESYTNDGDAFDIQPAGGYRLIQPTYDPQLTTFNPQFVGLNQ